MSGKTTTDTGGAVSPGHRSRREDGLLAALAAVLVFSIYLPLLIWLTRATFTIGQLNAGGLLLVMVTAVAVRDAVCQEGWQPGLNLPGILLLLAGTMLLWPARLWAPLAFPLVLLSCGLSLAALSSFLFGVAAVRLFMPVIGGLFVLGLLAAWFPHLDWPLRAVASRASLRLLRPLDIPVELLMIPGRPPEILLEVRRRLFLVATECNGFGLLSSSLLLATVLAFRNGLRTLQATGLLLLSVPLSLLINGLRIMAISLLATHTAWPYYWIHEGVGGLLYAAGLGFVWWLASFYADRQ